MPQSVAPQSLTVKPGTGDQLVVTLDSDEVCFYEGRVAVHHIATILDMEDAITVAKAILAFAGENEAHLHPSDLLDRDEDDAAYEAREDARYGNPDPAADRY